MDPSSGEWAGDHCMLWGLLKSSDNVDLRSREMSGSHFPSSLEAFCIHRQPRAQVKKGTSRKQKKQKLILKGHFLLIEIALDDFYSNCNSSSSSLNWELGRNAISEGTLRPIESESGLET